jgi:hypothetical protein
MQGVNHALANDAFLAALRRTACPRLRQPMFYIPFVSISTLATPPIAFLPKSRRA